MTTKTTQHDLFDLIGLAVLNTLGWALIGVVVAVWWMVLFPMISIPLVVAVWVGVMYGWVLGVVVVGVFIAGIMLWRWKCPEMFERWVTSRARTRFLAWWRYHRRWTRLAIACHLSLTRNDSVLVPRLESVHIGASIDRLRVRMLEGHCPADYENRVDSLAHTFRVLECRATIVGPGLVELAMRHQDSLAKVVDLPRQNGNWSKDAA